MFLHWLAALLGLCTPVVPMFGSGWLLGLALFFLVSQAFGSRRADISWAAPLLCVFGVWVLSEVLWGIDIKSLGLLWAGNDGPGSRGLANVLSSLYSSPPFTVLVVLSFLRFLVLVALCSFFARHAEQRERFLNGLDFGLGLSAVLTALSLLLPEILQLPNHSAFWLSIRRASGTFTDPNAFGIFVTLALPLILWRASTSSGPKRQYLFALFLVWLVLGAYSGSRSFFLGLALYALWFAARKSRRALVVFLSAACLSVAGINVLLSFYPAALSALAENLPQGPKRILDGVSLSNVADTFFSRQAFWRIGWEMWLDNFFFGVGFEHFRFHVPEYAARLGLATGTWTDNSNNFYLGLLAECGVLGGIALLFSLSALHWKQHPSASYLRASVVALTVLLLVGPHLVFDEVAILFALLLSFTCELRAPRRSWGALAVSFLMAGGILFKGSLLSRGFYNWEQEGQTALRWTARTAQDSVGCTLDGKARISVRALNPDILTHPVMVRVAFAARPPKELELKSSEWQAFEVDCPRLTTVSPEGLSLRYSIEVGRVWVPRKYGLGEDARLLGVQVRQEAAASS